MTCRFPITERSLPGRLKWRLLGTPGPAYARHRFPQSWPAIQCLYGPSRRRAALRDGHGEHQPSSDRGAEQTALAADTPAAAGDRQAADPAQVPSALLWSETASRGGGNVGRHVRSCAAPQGFICQVTDDIPRFMYQVTDGSLRAAAVSFLPVCGCVALRHVVGV